MPQVRSSDTVVMFHIFILVWQSQLLHNSACGSKQNAQDSITLLFDVQVLTVQRVH
jgi:hypothetical protein